jgi:hypothetical protein
MLRLLAAGGRLDPTLNTRMRGVIIVADAGDAAPKILARVADQCSGAGFGVPPQVGVWTLSPHPNPPVAALLTPTAGPGGLETLCLEHLRPRHPEVSACLDAYLGCIPKIDRTSEKHDKAGLACLIAAIERRDPTMTLARAFSGRVPTVDVKEPTFAPFAEALSVLLSQVP